MSEISIEILRDAAAIAAVAADWRELATPGGWAEVTPEWFDAWRLQQAPGEEALVAVALEAGRLVAVLPLERSRVHGVARLRFPGAHLGTLFSPPIEVAEGGALVQRMLSELARRVGWSALVLHELDRDAELTAELRRRYAVQEVDSREAPYEPLAGQSWESYLAARGTGRGRLAKRLQMSSLRSHHDVVLRRTATAAELGPDLELVRELHGRRFPRSGLLGPRERRFHDEFAARALERGWLRLLVCEADGRPAAAVYGWRIGGRFCAYQMGFEQAFARHSPGIGILGAAFEAAFEEGAETLELLLGKQPYKEQLATRSRRLVSLLLTRRSSPLRPLLGFAARRQHA